MMFPPALPPSRSHPCHRPFGAGQCQGWGRVGARAGLVLGMITPPSTPLPTAQFFRGVPREGGLREALRHPDLPRPLPHHSTPGSSRSWRDLDSWGRVAGGGAGTGTNAHPTTQLTLATPITPPPPPEPSPELSPVAFFPKADWTESTGSGFGWGRGLGGLSRPLTQPSPPPSQERLPPSDVRADGQRFLGRRGVWWG